MNTETKSDRPTDDVGLRPNRGPYAIQAATISPRKGKILTIPIRNPQKKTQPRKKTTAVGNQRKDSPAATGQRH